MSGKGTLPAIISRQAPLELLRPPSGRCLGAAFSTYCFDEHFFEIMLAALLPIHADPDSDTHMFLAEARRRLRETPVIVIADRHGYVGGHRLPFQLVLAPASTAHHARMGLLLFERQARLLVGSANLTATGFGGSADLCGVLQLDYKKDSVLILRALEVLELAGAAGEGWIRLVRQCRALVGSTVAKTPHRLLASTNEASVMAQFLSGIGARQKIHEVHLVAAGQPEDDARSGGQAIAELSLWLKKRARRARVNLAVAWPDASVSPPAERTLLEPEQLPGYLCAELRGPPGAEGVHWAPVERVEKNKVYLEGEPHPLAKHAVAAVLRAEPPKFWAVEEVTGVGLLDATEAVGSGDDVRWWLYPEVQRAHGEVRRRPLHARLLVVCSSDGKERLTHVLLGCPNFERTNNPNERVFEVGLQVCHAGHLPITHFCPELVQAPSEGFYLEDRSWLATEGRPAAPLEHATYDAKLNLLTLDWQVRAPDCRVYYQRGVQEEEILKERPKLRTQVPGFILGHDSAELRVVWNETQALVPINVINSPSLSADEPEGELQLFELIALHGGQGHTPGARFTAREVFSAQEALVAELAATGAQLGAFDVAIEGPAGLHAFVERLFSGHDCDATEAWIYAMELYKQLGALRFGNDALGKEKKGVIKAVLAELDARLKSLAAKLPWSAEVAKLYRSAG